MSVEYYKIREYKIFLKSKNGDKFIYLTDFNDFQFDTIIDLLKRLHLGSKVIIEVKCV